VSDPRAELAGLLAGGPILHAIACLAELGIPDLLVGGPHSTTDLAQATGSHEDSLYRLLRALAGAGVLAEGPGREFALTPMSELLRTGVPGSMHAIAVLAGEPWRRAWYDLPQAVRTGEPAAGASFYESLARDPAAALRFDAAMRHKWASLAPILLDAYDFSRAARIVDVGGGSGALLEAILARHPEATGALLEAPVIAAEARRRLEGQRCEVVDGDFTDAVPPGGDLYLLAFVLHNWDDRRAAAILANCRRATSPGGRVLVVESVVPAGTGPSAAKIHDLEMLVFMPGGRERTEDEYAALFAQAGLTLDRVIATETSASLLEGSPE
jgi:SAM-dependent methyltransferase